ncbi:FecR family protein [Roseivirga pacifica]|uniref:FecR family protein n=1 Tax=Roseivirga pacifica TaxID=1267423 RepID=UPI00227BAF18|nr:FecR family protein [Roseivirga pacifica]
MRKDSTISTYLNDLSEKDAKHLTDVLEKLETLEAPSLTSKTNAWEAIQAKIDTKPKGKTISFKPNTAKRGLMLIAAAAIIILAIFQFIPEAELTIIENPAGKTLTELLPDGSTVALNADSKIEYDKENWERNRTITLTGEAFFNVKEGEDFTVNFPNGKVEVLGTSFNIYARDDKSVVSCATGIVKTSFGEKETILIGGKSATYTETVNGTAVFSKIRTDEVSPSEVGRWQSGEHYFTSAKLTNVIKALERQFNIHITSKTDLSERYYSGYFSSGNLEEALELVFVPMGLSYQTEGDQVIVE